MKAFFNTYKMAIIVSLVAGALSFILLKKKN